MTGNKSTRSEVDDISDRHFVPGLRKRNRVGKNLNELKKQALSDTFRISFRNVLELLFRFLNQPVGKDSIITVNNL